jgi:hypothetical protein
MKLFLRKRMPAAVLMLLGFCAFYAFRPADMPAGDRAPQAITEGEAIKALTRLGVPLQKDNRGDVRWIEATNGEFSDEAMQYLPRLSKLEWLEIGGGKVGPSEIAKLKGCPLLVRLYIHDIKLGGDELAWLSGLTKLEALSLQRTGINGKIIKNIAASDLAVLNLSGNEITDDDMAQIARLKNLEVLALADTKITGAGIAKLEGMKRLNEFNIIRCTVHDSDLESFLSMPNLRIVYAEGCDISPVGIQSVVSRFPMLAIFR